MLKQILKRLLSIMLALSVVLALMPTFTITSFANSQGDLMSGFVNSDGYIDIDILDIDPILRSADAWKQGVAIDFTFELDNIPEIEGAEAGCVCNSMLYIVYGYEPDDCMVANSYSSASDDARRANNSMEYNTISHTHDIDNRCVYEAGLRLSGFTRATSGDIVNDLTGTGCNLIINDIRIGGESIYSEINSEIETEIPTEVESEIYTETETETETETQTEVKNGIYDGYYYENDVVVKGAGLIEIDGDYYYINSKGKVFVGTISVTAAKSNGLMPAGTYEFGADGKMIIPEETETETEIEVKNDIYDGYYYENDAVAKGVGLVEIDGDYYYIDSKGRVFVGTIAVTEAKANGLLLAGTYEFGADGKMIIPQETEAEVKNGIYDGYYYENNAIVKGAGVVEIDGDYYYIDSKGRVFVGTITVTATKANGLMPAGTYVFGSDGKMIIDDGPRISNGYYYVDNEIVKNAGMVQIDGDYYYIGSKGQIFKGTITVTAEKANGLVVPDTYEFGNDGKMVTRNNGKIADGYYYENGELTKDAGIVEIGGYYYYINSKGKTYTGTISVTADKTNGLVNAGTYEFGEDGRMIINNSPKIVNGYYYENNAIAKGAGIVQVNDNYYYIGSRGQVFIGTITVTADKTNGLIPAGKYTTESDGIIVVEIDAETESDTDELPDTRTYYRSTLESNAQKGAYDSIVNCIQNFAETAMFNALSADNFTTVLEAVMKDHPEFFHISNEYSYFPYGGSVIGYSPVYLYDINTAQKYEAATQTIDNALADVIATANTKSTVFDKVLYVHDQLRSMFYYDNNFNSTAYDVYGAITTGTCVCEGYAETFAYVLNKLSIPNILCDGYATTSGSSGGHRWNMVYIDGRWYHFDVTWDDSYNNLSLPEYAYFAVTTEDILNSRTIYGTVPAATATESNFYYKNDLVATSTDTDELYRVADNSASLGIVENGVTFRFENADDYSAFLSDSTKINNLVRHFVGNVGFSRSVRYYSDLNVIILTWKAYN